MNIQATTNHLISEQESAQSGSREQLIHSSALASDTDTQARAKCASAPGAPTAKKATAAGPEGLPGSFTVDERYTATSGTVLLSGVQALVRALTTQAQLDAQQGLTTGGFVSGYRGSPLGGLDKELWSQERELQKLNVQFQPGVNEELAATAVWGSQHVGLHAGANVEGAFGLWYGKAPGLDRSCDAIRHANYWGTARQGGVLLVVGDDPAAKSSSLATQSEFTLQDMMVPILSPSNVQEVLDFAIHGWAMSRHSGLWVGLKAIADHMDSASTVQVGLERHVLPAAGALAATDDVHIRQEDTPAEQEVRMLKHKIPAALDYARAAHINRWVTKDAIGSRPAKLGIVAAGKAYADVREAFSLLGLTTLQDIRAQGVELLQLGMTWPLDDKLIKAFSERCEKLLVVEEKRAFVEPQVKDVLYDFRPFGRAIPVLGKFDEQGEALLPSAGQLSVDKLVSIICDELGLSVPAHLLAALAGVDAAADANAPARQERTPLFCAGCPHNTSTRVPEGSRASAGIGCHYMVQWMNRDTDSCTQMGGEGVTWVGEQRFTDEAHIFANLGDGTYFHSGILAIRQAVAAKVNITYKILFNDAVAMTGGQPTDGELDIDKLVAQLKAEGVRRIVIVSDEPAQHEGRFPGVDVFHRSELDTVQQMLRDVSGVTALIYQQTCATELRRRRKRGLVEDVRPRVVINEAVCEGCGDCTVQSSCVAVEPVVTDNGLKRQINQTACNKDLSCATGYCPAFIEVKGELRSGEVRLGRAAANSAGGIEFSELANLPSPKQVSAGAVSNILIAGVGGTGIVTVSALLAAAAKLDGREVATLDMTGLAQKGGAVYSHVRFGSTLPATARIPNGQADVLLGCDLVSAAANEALALMSAKTRAVTNTHVSPTADFVLAHSGAEGGSLPQLQSQQARLQRIEDLVGHSSKLAADDLVRQALGGTQQSNVFLLGYAYQDGGIPLSVAALEEAIRINGVDVDKNLLAFRLGRQAALTGLDLPKTEQSKVGSGEQAVAFDLEAFIEDSKAALIEYAGGRCHLADHFEQRVRQFQTKEDALRPGACDLTREVAIAYRQLLMQKDEYEVARLHSDASFKARLQQEFVNPQVQYLLAPPLLGVRKRRFGSWMNVAFRVLASVRSIRNTVVDPFRYTQERQQGLAIIAEFETLCDTLLQGLSMQTLPIAKKLVQGAQEIRGFGHVRARHLERYRMQTEQLLVEFHRPAETVVLFDPAAAKVKQLDVA